MNEDEISDLQMRGLYPWDHEVPTPKPTGAPREWWIMPEQASYEQQVFAEDPSYYYPTTKGQLVHVIEKSYATHFEVLARRQLAEISALKAERVDHYNDMIRIQDAERKADALTASNKKLREALEFVVAREDFSFAECSVAEEIWSRCKKALKESE